MNEAGHSLTLFIQEFSALLWDLLFGNLHLFHGPLNDLVYCEKIDEQYVHMALLEEHLGNLREVVQRVFYIGEIHGVVSAARVGQDRSQFFQCIAR